jgi:cell division septation protein DedD
MTSPLSDKSDPDLPLPDAPDPPLLAKKGQARPAVQLPSQGDDIEDAETAFSLPDKTPPDVLEVMPDDLPAVAETEAPAPEALQEATPEADVPEVTTEAAEATADLPEVAPEANVAAATPASSEADEDEAKPQEAESTQAGPRAADPAPPAKLEKGHFPVPPGITLEATTQRVGPPIRLPSPPDIEAGTEEDDTGTRRSDLAAWRSTRTETPPSSRRGPWLVAGSALAAAIALAAVLTSDLIPPGLLPGLDVAQRQEDLNLTTASAKPEHEETPALPSEAPPAAQPQVAAVPPAGDDPSANFPPHPEVEVMRIEPDGRAFISGRAEPGTQLLVLNNGTAVGTATADSLGFWTFVSGDPLPPGDHSFALDIHTEMNPISLPAATEAGRTEPSEAESPGTGTSGDQAAPTPVRKPDPAAAQQTTGAAKTGSYVIQLASVFTADDAERAQGELRRRYPDLLEGMTLFVDQATLDDRGEVFRLRSGPFANLSEAREACARFEARNHDCLVVRLQPGAKAFSS